MPRSIWKGAIQLGLLTIPVKLYAATEARGGLSFNMLCKQDQQRVSMPTVCPTHGAIPRTETVKGYEWAKGNYVVVTDEDFGRVALPSTHAIVIERFVPAGAVTSFVKGSYYLAPEVIGNKAYAMLRGALGNRVGIAKIAMRERESLAALSTQGNVIVMNTLFWPDEVRDPGELDLPGEELITPAEQAMAGQLITSMTGEFDPAAYHDAYREALLKIIEAKLEGQEPEAPAVTAPAPELPSLIDILKASVAAHKQEA